VGPFAVVPGSYLPDVTTGPGEAWLQTRVDVTLPPETADRDEVQLRILTTNALGIDECIGIDDIEVTGGPLPVQLASLAAIRVGTGTVRLRWLTLTEVNNYGFYVQRTTVGNPEFANVYRGFVPGRGTTNVPQEYEFVDTTAVQSELLYRLRQVDLDGASWFSDPVMVREPTSVSATDVYTWRLHQNFPNPFNPSTTIQFEMAEEAKVRIEVVDIIGQTVAVLLDRVQKPGPHAMGWHAGALPSGVYFLVMQVARFRSVRKILLAR
jgi:hypothetical protein